MVPDRWEVRTLGSLGEFTNGINKSKEDFGFGSPFVNLQDVFGVNEISIPPLGLVNATPEEIRRYNLKVGDVLFVRSSVKPSGVGLTAVVTNELEQTVFSGFIIRFRQSKAKLITPFLKFCFYEPSFRRCLLASSSISANTNINQKSLEKLTIAVPPRHEQEKIAAILSSVDEAIASTQAVIDQTRKVKQGLLQQLLTRGEHSNKKDVVGTKKAPLRLLDEVAKRVTGHTPNRKKPEYWDGGIKWVSLQDSAALDRVYIHETAAEISEEGIRNSSAVKHPKGTVVLSRDAGVGKSAITTDEMAVSQHFIGWICGLELDNHYLYYWLQYMKPVFEEIAIGSTIKTIGMPFFKKLKIPVPPIETQIQIASILLSTDKQFFFAEEELERLNILKRGLMQDLLTGRVRVYSQE